MSVMTMLNINQVATVFLLLLLLLILLSYLIYQLITFLVRDVFITLLPWCSSVCLSVRLSVWDRYALWSYGAL